MNNPALKAVCVCVCVCVCRPDADLLVTHYTLFTPDFALC